MINELIFKNGSKNKKLKVYFHKLETSSFILIFNQLGKFSIHYKTAVIKYYLPYSILINERIFQNGRENQKLKVYFYELETSCFTLSY